MSQNKFINLEELSKTTQALLIKINEQSNLKVNKSSVSANFDAGTKIGSVNGIDFYTPFITADEIASIVAPVALSNNYYDLDNIPTRLSNFANDAGYLTSYTETDPTVPAWAKASQKPTYTADEIGAVPSLTGSSGNKVEISTAAGSNITSTFSVALAGNSGTSSGNFKLQTTNNGAQFILVANGGMTISAAAGYDGLKLTSNKITGLADPSGDSDAANKQYVDNAQAKIKTTAGDNNIEFDLIGTAPANTNSEAVPVYKPTLITFAKTNEFGRLTLGSSTIPGIIRLYSSTTNATGYTDLKGGSSSNNTRTITFPDADGTVALTNDIPNVPSWALAANKPTYTASEVGAATTSDVSSMISSAVSGITSFSTEVVQTLPATGVTGRFYFVPSNVGTNNIYEEYIYVNNTWEKLGNFDASTIDLSGYVPAMSGNNGTLYQNYLGTLIQNDSGSIYIGHLDDTEQSEASIHLDEYGLDLAGMPDKNKPVTIRGLATPSDDYDAANKQYVDTVAANSGVTSFNGSTGAITYIAPVTSVNGNTGAVTLNIPSTASDINAAADTHSHGYLNADGTFSSQMPIASNDCLIISDNSNSNKLARSTLAFGSSTTQYLANNGTWQNAAPIITHSYSNDALIGNIMLNSTNSSSSTLSATSASGALTFSNTGVLQIGKAHSSEGSKGSIKLSNNASSNKDYTTITPSATAAVTLTLPSATGTLALTSDIPSVPSWALESTKPTYTASEVGAAASSHSHSSISTTAGGGDVRAAVTTESSNSTVSFSSSYGASSIRTAAGTITLVTQTTGPAQTNTLTINGGQISGLATPTADTMAANKAYVDNVIPQPYNATTNPNGYLTMANLPLYDGTVE